MFTLKGLFCLLAAQYFIALQQASGLLKSRILGFVEGYNEQASEEAFLAELTRIEDKIEELESELQKNKEKVFGTFDRIQSELTAPRSSFRRQTELIRKINEARLRESLDRLKFKKSKTEGVRESQKMTSGGGANQVEKENETLSFDNIDEKSLPLIKAKLAELIANRGKVSLQLKLPLSGSNIEELDKKL